MAAKPFETKIQDLVYNVDVGIGHRLTKYGLSCLGVLLLMLLYTATQFRGLRDAEAMDYGQLGRNLVARHHFITQCIRPFTLWGLVEKSSKHNPMINEHPDILHPPLWPLLLAVGFKMTGVSLTDENIGGIFPPEQWVIIPLCHLFTLLTGIIVFLLGNQLFDRRISLLAVIMFFLSDTVWSTSILGIGIPLATFLVTTSVYAALIAVTRLRENSSMKRWLAPLGFSVVLCVLAFLTRYATVVIVPAIALFIGLSLKKRGWTWALVFITVFLIGISPWLVRNVIVSGNPLGMAPYTALIGTQSFPDDVFERTLFPRFEAGKVVNELLSKASTNLAKYYKNDFRVVGEGLFIGFFLTAFFYRFVRVPVHLLRWCLALAMFLLLILASFFGDATARLFVLFWPFIILYGFAFFFILLERLQLPVPLFKIAIQMLFVVLGALPLILTLMPPRTGFPYPPYHPPFVLQVCKLLQPNEMMCSDMPWATAWYGNRNSLLVPATIDEFYEINDYTKRISGLYLTTLMRNKPWVNSLLSGPERTWFPLLEGRIPIDFPLTHGFPLNNMDQIFLTDRVRWNE